MNPEAVDTLALGGSFLVALVAAATASTPLVVAGGVGIVATVLVRMKRHQDSPAASAGTPSSSARPLTGRGDGLNSYGPQDDPC